MAFSNAEVVSPWHLDGCTRPPLGAKIVRRSSLKILVLLGESVLGCKANNMAEHI